MYEYEDESDLLPCCPVCDGSLHVLEDLKVVCLDCEASIGWYIENAGAVKLMPEWYTDKR